MSAEILTVACVITLVATSVLHSVGGEVYLLRPLFKYRGNRVLDNALARMVLRFAWHVTSIMWLVLAIILYALVFDSETLSLMIYGSIGLSFLAIGLFDMCVSKGKHIGWPFLVLTGVLALLLMRMV